MKLENNEQSHLANKPVSTGSRHMGEGRCRQDVDVYTQAALHVCSAHINKQQTRTHTLSYIVQLLPTTITTTATVHSFLCAYSCALMQHLSLSRGW